MLLLSRFLRSDLRRMSYPTLDTHLFQQFQEPLHRAGGFDSHQHWTFQGCVKRSYCIPFVAKCLLGELAGFAVHHGYGFLSGVQSASYNFHLGLLRPEPFWLDTAKSTRSVVRPTSLCHQPQAIGLTARIGLVGIPVAARGN